MQKNVLNLDNLKATSVWGIPADMLKFPVDLHLPFATKIINLSFKNNCFSDDIKPAKVSTIYKKRWLS